MSESLFRRETLDHISSPEDLHSYMRVTSPRLWMLLSAILALLIGFVVYASTTVMESTVEAVFSVQSDTLPDGEKVTSVSATLPVSRKDQVEIGMPVRISGRQGKITLVYRDEEDLIVMAEMAGDQAPLPDGDYDGEIVTESTTPLSFLLN